MADVFYRDEKERQNVESFIREKKEEFERQEFMKEADAKVKGETYDPKEFPGVSEVEALAAVRDGWKSRLDLMFERKYKREKKNVIIQ